MLLHKGMATIFTRKLSGRNITSKKFTQWFPSLFNIDCCSHWPHHRARHATSLRYDDPSGIKQDVNCIGSFQSFGQPDLSSRPDDVEFRASFSRKVAVLVQNTCHWWVLTLLLVIAPYLAAVAHKTRMRVSIVFRTLSFVTIVVMSLFMYRMARWHENQIAAHLPVPAEGQQIQQRERKALKTTVAVLGTLVLCQIPMFTSSFLFRIKVFDKQAFVVALWPTGTLMHLNSCLNLCIFGWRNVDIREKIQELLCTRQNDEVAISSSLAPPPAPRTQSTSC